MLMHNIIHARKSMKTASLTFFIAQVYNTLNVSVLGKFRARIRQSIAASVSKRGG